MPSFSMLEVYTTILIKLSLIFSTVMILNNNNKKNPQKNQTLTLSNYCTTSIIILGLCWSELGWKAPVPTEANINSLFLPEVSTDFGSASVSQETFLKNVISLWRLLWIWNYLNCAQVHWKTSALGGRFICWQWHYSELLLLFGTCRIQRVPLCQLMCTWEWHLNRHSVNRWKKRQSYRIRVLKVERDFRDHLVPAPRDLCH